MTSILSQNSFLKKKSFALTSGIFAVRMQYFVVHTLLLNYMNNLIYIAQTRKKSKKVS